LYSSVYRARFVFIFFISLNGCAITSAKGYVFRGQAQNAMCPSEACMTPFPVSPKGDRRKGREAPHAAERWRLPLQEGFQSALLKTPLLFPRANRAIRRAP
jgi:hypothetical protein